MRFLWVAIILFGALFIAQAASRTFDLSKVPENSAPPGFRSAVAGKGDPGDWRVIMDDVPPLIPNITPNAPIPRRPVIAQLARPLLDDHAALLILDDEIFGDFSASLRFKTVSGVLEQMAGVAFRIQDEKNYYYVRASSKGRTFRFFKVTQGALGPPIGPEIEIPTGVWHEMRVQCRGNEIRCWLNGAEIIPLLTDNTFNSGKIGLWTKSDSVSYFTDLNIEYTPREPLARMLVREVMEKYPRLSGIRIYALDPSAKQTKVIASSNPDEVGQAGSKVESDVLLNNPKYQGRENGVLLVTMPLHDKNGDVIAAVKFLMKPFPGQTQENALARALPLVRAIELRIQTAKDLF